MVVTSISVFSNIVFKMVLLHLFTKQQNFGPVQNETSSAHADDKINATQ